LRDKCPLQARVVCRCEGRAQEIIKMGCPAMGISVAFLKQPALPGEAPETKKILNNSKKILKKF
jgi:hypothetical protein